MIYGYLFVLGSMLMGSANYASEKDVYVAAVGEAGSERLTLQSKLHHKNTSEFLEKIGPLEGKVVWDVGCGNGEITAYLAEKVGETGTVYAIDFSQEQLDLAEKRAKDQGSTNVKFICADIYELDTLDENVQKPDVIYTRLILMHLTDPLKAIKTLKMCLKEGGVVASQEPTMRTASCSIESDMFQDYFKTLMALGAGKGCDFNIGERLDELYRQADYTEVETYYRQQNIFIKDAKKPLVLGFGEWGSKAIEAQLVTQETLDDWKRIIENLPETDSLDFKMARHTYTLAYK